MKRMNFWLLASLFVGAVTLSSCGDDDEVTSDASKPDSGIVDGGGSDKVDYSKTGGSCKVKTKEGVEVTDISIPKFTDKELAGVQLNDNELSFSYYYNGDSTENYVYRGCSVSITDYSESKATYSGNDVYFGFSQGEGNTYFQGTSVYHKDGEPVPSNLTVTVKKQDGCYSITVEGDFYLSGTDIRGDGEPNATVQLNVVAPLVATTKLHRKVSSKQSYFPAGTPWLEGKTVEGALEIQSPLVGNGVLLWYYGDDLGYDQYLDLKAQAVKTMGQPFECWDDSQIPDSLADEYPNDQGWSDIACAYFYKDKKYVMVSYCPWRGSETDEKGTFYGALPYGLGSIRENHAAGLHVHVLEGMNVDYDQFVFKMR